MSFSMTGYGQSSLQFGGYKITFEVKSVNNRYCEVVLRMPRGWTVYEDMLRRKVQQRVKRGRVDVIINREIAEEAAATALNRSAVRSYLEAAEALRSEFGISGELSLPELLSLPGVMELKEEAADGLSAATPDEFSDMLEQGLEESLASLLEMRAREGQYLAADMLRRIDRLQELHRGMVKLAPEAVLEYREKLRQRLSGLSDGTFPFDEHKFGMEIAIFADRCNIDEELTRLQSHFGQCRALLQGREPAGRKLDFLVQEMNRETNTIGMKCSHLTLVNLTLEIKAELEKIREQAANLE